jgi:hypothetical protein
MAGRAALVGEFEPGLEPAKASAADRHGGNRAKVKKQAVICHEKILFIGETRFRNVGPRNTEAQHQALAERI